MSAFQPVKPAQQSKMRYGATIQSVGGGGANSGNLARMASASNGLASQLPSSGGKLSTQASEQPFYAAKNSAFSTVFKNETAAFVVSNNDTFPAFGRSVDKGMDTRLGSQIGYNLKI